MVKCKLRLRYTELSNAGRSSLSRASLRLPSITRVPQFTNMKTSRPKFGESFKMKMAVVERDGLEKGCYWCGKKFPGIWATTLEHILPLADGGKHELDNCALACEPCNLKNVPVSIRVHSEIARSDRLRRAEWNRCLNGGGPENPRAQDCSPQIASRFEALYRERKGKLMTFADASFSLKVTHNMLRLPPPTQFQKHVFKAHFNRWANQKAQQSIISDQPVPEGYISPFASTG